LALASPTPKRLACRESIAIRLLYAAVLSALGTPQEKVITVSRSVGVRDVSQLPTSGKPSGDRSTGKRFSACHLRIRRNS
jgi:hypothetical protein